MGITHCYCSEENILALQNGSAKKEGESPLPILLLCPHSCAHADVIPTPPPFCISVQQGCNKGHLRDDGH